MDLKSRIKCLTDIDLFGSFSETEILGLAENVEEVRLAGGEVIFKEGEVGEDMFILLAGSIKIFKDNRYITIIEPIDYIGEMALIEKKPRSATATVLDPVHLFKINFEQFDRYLAPHPHALTTLIKTLSSRIRKDTELLSQEFQKANILIHDIKNRLTGFLLLDLIRDKDLSEKSVKYLRLMKNCANDLTTMADEAMANAKRLKYSAPPALNSLTNLLMDLANSVFTTHPSLQDKIVNIDIAPTLEDFVFHKVDIHRVITNLVINAGQASLPGSTIDLKVLSDPESVTILIKDQGSGIDEAIKDKVFSANFTTKEDGNGLGLSSCRSIIEERYGGHISFDSSAQGTTFTIILPRTTTK